MRLIHLLVSELKNWPKEFDHALLTQSVSGQVEYVVNNSLKWAHSALLPTAEDWGTAIVSKDDWLEARSGQQIKDVSIPSPLREAEQKTQQKTGGSVDYYKCHVADPISGGPKYTAESIDIIEALGMTFAEGEAFKAIWRTCTGRMGGAVKADNKALYNAEKVEFFGARMVRAAKRSEAE